MAARKSGVFRRAITIDEVQLWKGFAYPPHMREREHIAASQQLVQGPVKVAVKAEAGGLPWPKPMSSTRMALKSGRKG